MSVAERPAAPVSGRDMSRSEREQHDSAPEELVRDIIGKIADKWTMLVLEVLEEHGRLRFTKLGELMGGVSQKMLTKTLSAIAEYVHPQCLSISARV